LLGKDSSIELFKTLNEGVLKFLEGFRNVFYFVLDLFQAVRVHHPTKWAYQTSAKNFDSGGFFYIT
jgi:hypothetical protein